MGNCRDVGREHPWVPAQATANLLERLGDTLTLTPDPDAWHLFDSQGRAL